jgi:hypothetical protein
MSDGSGETAKIRHYFVDEAGDPTLFDRRGRLIVGTEGCSQFFILGKLAASDPESLAGALTGLRKGLLADPYFQGVPSMLPEQRKTAIAFHAKDDLPEVRREVFKLLVEHDVQFFAVVRDKQLIAQRVRQRNREQPKYRYHPNQLYDRCVSQLFKERLHKHAGYSIAFARRGNSDRTEALSKALEAARSAFRNRWGIIGNAPIEIIPARPDAVICLQAADYFLWALQRFYEKSEDRFLNLIWAKVKLVLDCDDTRTKAYGVYYNQANSANACCPRKKIAGGYRSRRGCRPLTRHGAEFHPPATIKHTPILGSRQLSATPACKTKSPSHRFTRWFPSGNRRWNCRPTLSANSHLRAKAKTPPGSSAAWLWRMLFPFGLAVGRPATAPR